MLPVPVIAAIISAIGGIVSSKLQSQGQAAQASASRAGSGGQQPYTPVSTQKASAVDAARNVAREILAQRGAAQQQSQQPVVANTGVQSQPFQAVGSQPYNQYLSQIIRQTMERYLGQRY